MVLVTAKEHNQKVENKGKTFDVALTDFGNGWMGLHLAFLRSYRIGAQEIHTPNPVVSLRKMTRTADVWI